MTERLSNKNPCSSCKVDRQIGNPNRWECECSRCDKPNDWKNECVKKLAEYETAEEEGRLVLLPAPLKDVDTFGKVDGSYWVRIPFRIGDTFYRIVTNIHTKRKSIEESIVSRIAITNSEIQIFSDNICGKGVFGRTAFVTSEETEKALKEMNRGNW